MEFLSSCKPERSIFLILQSVLFFLDVEAVTEVFIRLGEIAKLPCDAPCVPEIQYRAISWYKVVDDGFGLSGIVRRDLKENISRQYLGFNGSVEVASASPYSLTIHNVSIEDLGRYQCSVWAPLGEQNKQGDVRLHKIDESNQSDGITWIMLMFIAVTICMLLILCMYLVHRKHSRAMETCAKQMSKNMKSYSQPYGDKIHVYTCI
ncbi:CD83 antigen-like isoform X2 [Cetorhinus maximus]